jgi:hypothetical protein
LAAGECHPVVLQVYNFADTPTTISLDGAAGDGWQVERLTRSVSVQPGGLETVECELVPERDETITSDGTATVIDQRPAFVEFWGRVDGTAVPRSTSLVVADDAMVATFQEKLPSIECQVSERTGQPAQVESLEWTLGDHRGSKRVDVTVPENGSETFTLALPATIPFYTDQETTLTVRYADRGPSLFREDLSFSPLRTGRPTDDDRIRAPDEGWAVMKAVETYGGS